MQLKAASLASISDCADCHTLWQQQQHHHRAAHSIPRPAARRGATNKIASNCSCSISTLRGDWCGRRSVRVAVHASATVDRPWLEASDLKGKPACSEGVLNFYTHTLCPYAQRVHLTLIEKVWRPLPGLPATNTCDAV